MPRTLQSLIQKLATARDDRELRLPFMDAAGELFNAQHWGISLGNQEGSTETVDLKGLPDSFIDYYTRFGTTIDPLREYVIKHHAPVHEQVLFTEESWKRSALYVHGCGLQYDREHAMAGPIVGHGQLMGMVHFARTSGHPAFDAKDLANLSALCTHLSAQRALLRVHSKRLTSEWANRLTARELQIAESVAKGLTNAEIGAELWITRLRCVLAVEFWLKNLCLKECIRRVCGLSIHRDLNAAYNILRLGMQSVGIQSIEASHVCEAS